MVRTDTGKPLLLIDVDGVLYPFAAPHCPDGYTAFGFFPDEEPVWLCLDHGRSLRELAEAFDLAWATGWPPEEVANHLSPTLGLPLIPAVTFDIPDRPFDPGLKVPPIDAFVGDRAAAWIDDQLTSEAYAWAEGRSSPTLLVEVDPAIGLTEEIIERLTSWATSLRNRG